MVVARVDTAARPWLPLDAASWALQAARIAELMGVDASLVSVTLASEGSTAGRRLSEAGSVVLDVQIIAEDDDASAELQA